MIVFLASLTWASGLADLDDAQCVDQLLVTMAPVSRSGPITVGGVLSVPPAVGSRSAEQTQAYLHALQARSSVPLIVAVDLEGGRFNPLDDHALLARVPSARDLGRLTEDEVHAWGVRTGETLKVLGVNLNLAPVLDVAGAEGHIGRFERSFASEPDRVVSHGGAFAQGLRQGGVGRPTPGAGSRSPTISTPADSSATMYWCRPFLPATTCC